MRDHVTTASNWQIIRKLDMVGCLAKKELSASIQGCPYEIHLEIVLTEKELYDMGWDIANVPEDRITYGLEAHTCEKEMEVHAMMWLRIAEVKLAMSKYDTPAWRLAEWDSHLPFLFECDPGLDDEETLQEERDTWV